MIRKRIVKSAMLFGLMFGIMISMSLLTFASEDVYESDYVPDSMQPGTVIYFESDGKFVIKEGGLTEDISFPIVIERGNTLGVTFEKPMKGIAGITVTYADDGLLDKILFKENQKENVMKYSESYVGNGIGTSVFFGAVYNAPYVPEEMAPGSVIVYNHDHYFKIQEGGLPQDGLKMPDLYPGNELGVIYERPHRGVKGIIVTYADDGFINDIIYEGNKYDAIHKYSETYIGTGSHGGYHGNAFVSVLNRIY